MLTELSASDRAELAAMQMPLVSVDPVGQSDPVGFDDLPMSGWVSPPLTTIVQPLAAMAAMATRTLMAMLDGDPAAASTRLQLTTSLVVRSSTSPAGRAG